MTTLYKWTQLTFEDGMSYTSEYKTPMSMEDIRTIFDRNSRLVDILAVNTEGNIERYDLRGLPVNDYAGTRHEKLFEFQKTMLPPKIVKPARKPIQVQVEIIDEKRPKLPCGHDDAPRDDCFDCQCW